MGRYEDEVSEGRAIDTRARAIPRKRLKPYVLIVVQGGIAEVALGGHRVDVDILDMDNLKDCQPGDASLSDREWDFLRERFPSDYERLGLALFTPAEEKAWEHYFRAGKDLRYGDTRAAEFAWRQMQTDPDFPRLKNFRGAQAGTAEEES